MALASLDEINVHLPDDKIEVDSDQYVPLQLDAERIVRGYLAGVFAPATLAGWDTPDHTPGLIRAIAGRLVAAFYYRLRYSEDSLTDPQYAQIMYNQAMDLLNRIISGEIVLEEVPEDAGTGDHFGAGDFYPNAAAPGPYFSLSGEL